MHTLSINGSARSNSSSTTTTTQLYRVAIQRHPALGAPKPEQLEHIHVAAHNGIDALLAARRITCAHNAFDPEPIGPIADVIAITAREATDEIGARLTTAIQKMWEAA